MRWSGENTDPGKLASAGTDQGLANVGVGSGTETAPIPLPVVGALTDHHPICQGPSVAFRNKHLLIIQWSLIVDHLKIFMKAGHVIKATFIADLLNA